MAFTTVQEAVGSGCHVVPRTGQERDRSALGCVGLARGNPVPQLLCGAAPAPAAANRGLPLTSAVAQQAPLGCWGVCKDWQDQTLEFLQVYQFFSQLSSC